MQPCGKRRFLLAGLIGDGQEQLIYLCIYCFVAFWELRQEPLFQPDASTELCARAFALKCLGIQLYHVLGGFGPLSRGQGA